MGKKAVTKLGIEVDADVQRRFKAVAAYRNMSMKDALNEALELWISRQPPLKKTNQTAKRVLLKVADGPEHIEIYTSEDEGVVDWSGTLPALYISGSINGAYFKLGPFQLLSIRQGIEKALGIA